MKNSQKLLNTYAIKERKITAETYSKNKTYRTCVYRKITHEDYVIWVKMIDLQKRLCQRNLCHVAMKKIKRFCGIKHPTKEQVKKYKKKMIQCVNGDKSVHNGEDLAYKLIRYINPGVTEPNEFRKNLGVENHKSFE